MIAGGPLVVRPVRTMRTAPVRSEVATKTCSTCQRPDIAAVNADLLASLSDDGPSINGLAKKYGIAKTSLLRHRRCLDRASPVEAQTPPVEVAPVAAQTPEVVPASDRSPAYKGKPGPGRPCCVCSSPVRAEIERLAMAKTPWLRIEREVEGAPSHDSIRDHCRRCVPDLLRRAHAESDNVEALRISEDLADIRGTARRLLGEAERLVEEARAALAATPSDPCDTCGSSPAAAGANLMRTIKQAADVMGKAKDVLRLVGGFTGELRERVEIDIREAKHWPRFLKAISDAVCDCEDCSERVTSALEKLGDA